MSRLTWARLQSAASEVRARLYERVLVYKSAESGSIVPTVRVLDRGEQRNYELPYDGQTLAGYWTQGWSLYAYFDDELPVSFAWARNAAEHRISEIGALVRATPAVGWIVHCITPEPFRGHGFYPKLIRSVARSLGGTSYIYCTASNAGSRRGIEKAGFQPVGMITRSFGRLSNTVAELQLLSDAGGATSG